MPRKKPPIRLAYATDLTDGHWALIEPLIPQAEPGGRPRKAAIRELADAILYFLRAGGGWRLLPHDLPPWQTVYYYLRRWQREGVWDWVHHALVMADRERAGREASPSAAILDSQSVRTADQNGARTATTRVRRSAAGITKAKAAVRAAIVEPWSNGQTEGQNQQAEDGQASDVRPSES